MDPFGLGREEGGYRLRSISLREVGVASSGGVVMLCGPGVYN